MKIISPQIQEVINFCQVMAYIEKESARQFDGWEGLLNLAIEAVKENLVDLAKKVPAVPTVPTKKGRGRPKKVR